MKRIDGIYRPWRARVKFQTKPSTSVTPTDYVPSYGIEGPFRKRKWWNKLGGKRK